MAIKGFTVTFVPALVVFHQKVFSFQKVAQGEKSLARKWKFQCELLATTALLDFLQQDGSQLTGVKSSQEKISQQNDVNTYILAGELIHNYLGSGRYICQ